MDIWVCAAGAQHSKSLDRAVKERRVYGGRLNVQCVHIS